MPAAHDIYAEQLSELQRGHPLYYPEPPVDDGPVEIGDVGYTKQGAFYRLFNVARPAIDPAQRFGVPEGFEPLHLGAIRNYETALEPGPLHSRTVCTLDADLGTPGTILPAEASFRFSCTSKRGAILMLETQMLRQEAVQSHLLERYLRRNCHSWYAFARLHHIQLGFGDIMLVTECSKTAAWSSVVYSNSSKEFGISFSLGNAFLPSAAGISALAGIERLGSVERRRSQQRVSPGNPDPPKDHTVFIKAYRLGTRQAYYQSLVYLFMRNRDPRLQNHRIDNHPESIPPETANEPSQMQELVGSSSNSLQTPGSDFEMIVIRPDQPDFHPGVVLLGLAMETSDSECIIVHDDDWCSATLEVSQIIHQYTDFYFNTESNAPPRAPLFPQKRAISRTLLGPATIPKDGVGMAMGPNSHGCRVGFWEANGQVVYGTVESTSRMPDGTEILVLSRDGGGTVVLPAAGVTKLA